MKLKLTSSNNKLSSVALYVSAWIEIDYKWLPMGVVSVALYVSAWIESLDMQKSVNSWDVALYVSARIEIATS